VESRGSNRVVPSVLLGLMSRWTATGKPSVRSPRFEDSKLLPKGQEQLQASMHEREPTWHEKTNPREQHIPLRDHPYSRHSVRPGVTSLLNFVDALVAARR